MNDDDFTNRQWTKFVTAAYVELPFAIVGRWLTRDETPMSKAGWDTYDSAVALANEAVNRLYSNRIVADAFGNVLEAIFRARYALEGPAIKVMPVSAPDEIISSKVNEPAAENRAASHVSTPAGYRRVARARRKAAA